MRLRNTRRDMLLLAAGALAIAGLIGSTAARAQQTGWALDPAHTEINFTVKHFFTPVNGTFEEFDAKLQYDPEKPAKSSVEVTIPVASINTNNQKRDDHLRSADWFEADKYPVITFKSESVRKTGEQRLVARGPLTIKGVTKEVELPITLLGLQDIPEPMREMMGGTQEVASFQASTQLARGDFGVGVGSWAATMVVGGSVDIQIVAEAARR